MGCKLGFPGDPCTNSSQEMQVVEGNQNGILLNEVYLVA
jgi:hypothetical protein